MAYLDTPRTEAGNATMAAKGIDDISFEGSFLSPKKRSHDLVSQMRSKRGVQSLRTPSARTALGNRPNPAGNRRSGEFTPLLQSVTKRNAFQGKENLPADGIRTPAFLKSGYVPKESPALGNQLGSSFYGSEPSFLADNPVELPQIASSSAQSTPVAPLHKGGQGVLDDQRNLMTLREQENIIDKVEKENFGLKLKIHFLEELLRKSDPNLNQNALKENTDLRVDKVQLQKELSKIRKSLRESEKLAENLKEQMRNSQDRVEKDQADQQLRDEVLALRQALEDKQSEIEDLKDQLTNDPRDQELGKLHDDVEDLESEVREKQRQIDSKDDEIDILNIKLQKAEDLEQQVAESKEQGRELEELENTVKQLRDEVKGKDEELEDLKDTVTGLQDDALRARSEAKEAIEEREYTEREKQNAIDDLEELRTEMAEKSFTTKGFSRQLEEKATKYESENHDLHDQIQDLKDQLERSSREAREFQDALEEEKQDNDFNQRQLQDEIDSLRETQEAATQNHDSSRNEVEHIRTELQKKTDEKDLLQSRHDALTVESQSLQREMADAQKQLTGLERDLEEEKQMSLENERSLRDETKRETDRLNSEVSSLQRKIETERGNQSNQQELWSSERRELQLEKEQAEQRAIGLQRTVERLQATQGSLSTKETQLQQALESEQQRHRDEQNLLSRQIEDLREDLERKRQTLDSNRTEIMRLKDQQRVSSRDNESFNEKIQALEDEIEVLQSSLEEDSEKGKADVAAARQEAEGVRRQLLTSKQEITRLEGELSDAQNRIETFQGDLEVGEGSKEQLNTRIRELGNQTNRLRNDKQTLQDEVNRLQAAYTSAQAEIDTFQHDLRAGKGSFNQLNARVRELESQVTQLENEKQSLQDELDTFQTDLYAGRGSNEQLNARIRDLESQLARIRKEKQSLRDELAGANVELDNLKLSANTNSEGDSSFLRRDLASSRAKELEATQKEARLKEDIRGLRKEISQLERRVHEAELAKLSNQASPNSSMLGSARKSEVIELRRQLNDSQSQHTTLRRQLRDAERSSREQISKAQADLVEQQADANAVKEELEARVADLNLRISQQQASASGDAQIISRLRTRISTLEKELKESRTATITESQMATERADLHRMLQETKLEAEDMAQLAMEQTEQLEIREKRESHLVSQLKVVRDECTMRQQKTVVLEKELVALQSRYEKLLREMSAMNDLLHDQQEDLKRHVHFVDDTVSDLQQNLRRSGDAVAGTQRQEQELADIKAQLDWMKAKLKREASQKNALVYEKQFLEKEIETFEACNRINLNMLRRVIPRRSSESVEVEETHRTLRHVGLAIISAIRIRNLARKWAATQERYKPKDTGETSQWPQRSAPQDRPKSRAAPPEPDVRPLEPELQRQKASTKSSHLNRQHELSEQQPKAKAKPKPKQVSQLANENEVAATPKLAELKRSLLAEGQAAANLLGNHASSKDFDIKQAEKFINAMVKTMKSFQKTDAGKNITEATPEVTEALSAISEAHPEQATTVTDISQTPQEVTDALSNISRDLTEESLSSHEEQTASTHLNEKARGQDDACVTLDIDESTLDLYQWAGRQHQRDPLQENAKTTKPQSSSRKETKRRADDDDDSSLSINTEVSEWFHRPDARPDRTRDSTQAETQTSQRQQPTSTKQAEKLAKPVNSSSQREKRKTSNDTTTTKNIFTAFDRPSSQREKRVPSQDVQPEQQASKKDKRKTIHRSITIQPNARKSTTQDTTTTSNISSVSSIDTREILESATNTRQFAASDAAKTEWWAKIRDGSERPIEGQMKIKWKGFVAVTDSPTGSGRSTQVKDQAVKRAMEKLALDKTMQQARSEARAHAKDGSLGKRKFQGRAG